MKSRPRLLQWSLLSCFVFVTLVAVLAPWARNRYHSSYEVSADLPGPLTSRSNDNGHPNPGEINSSYEISADYLGPLTSRSNDNWHPNPGEIKFYIEKQADFCQSLVPPGSSIISVQVREHDRYVGPATEIPLIGWAEHRHTIFRCEIKGLDQNGEKFSRIRFVDSHHYYMLDDADSGAAVPHEKIAN